MSRGALQHLRQIHQQQQNATQMQQQQQGWTQPHAWHARGQQLEKQAWSLKDLISCQQTCVFKFKIVFLRGKQNVPPAIKQYKNRGNASNLVQSHFGSPQLKRLESGIAPLVTRGFDPACWGLYQPSPSPLGTKIVPVRKKNVSQHIQKREIVETQKIKY